MKPEDLVALQDSINRCQKCSLGSTAIKKVIWSGALEPVVVFVGEAPGAEEDKTGIPFVGKAGKLIREQWIPKLNLEEKFTFVNILKCRPPENRDPQPEEIAECLPFLEEQLELLNPRLIVCLGMIATSVLAPQIVEDGKVLSHIGEVSEWHGIPVMSFVHPAYVIRNPDFAVNLPAIQAFLKAQVVGTAIPEMGFQKAIELARFEMISPCLAATHYFCTKAGKVFVNVDTRMKCKIDGRLTYLCSLESDSFTLPFEMENETNVIFYKVENEKFKLLGWLTSEQVARANKQIAGNRLNPISSLIHIVAEEEEEEAEPQPFAHLHTHSEYSIGDGFGTPKYIAKQARKKGFKALAITDHGTLQGTIYMQEALLGEGIKPILGVEGYVKHEESYFHLVLLAKNKMGWNNLLKIHEDGVRNHFHYKPRYDLTYILSHAEGLIATTACQSGLIGKYILENKPSTAEQHLQVFKAAFGDDLYIELMPNRMKEQVAVNKAALKLAEKHKVKCIITTDSHYPNKEDKTVHDALKAISRKKPYSEGGFSDDTFYLLTADEVKELVKEHHPYMIEKVDECFENTFEIVKKCSFKVSYPQSITDTLPKFKIEDKEFAKWQDKIKAEPELMILTNHPEVTEE